MGQYGSGARSSTHHSMLRSSTSSRSLTPNAAAVSLSPTTLRLITYGTRASSRCSRSELVLTRAGGCAGGPVMPVLPSAG